MTTIARATNDKGQAVGMHQRTEPYYTVYSVTVGIKTVCRWTNEQNAYAQFVNACAVGENHE